MARRDGDGPAGLPPLRRYSLLLPFMAATFIVAVLVAVAMSWIFARPLDRSLRNLLDIPLQMATREIHGIATESFHRLLDERKEADPAEVGLVKEEVISRITHHKPFSKDLRHLLLIVDENRRVINGSFDLFPVGSALSWSEAEGTNAGEIRIPAPDGTVFVGYMRDFPAWRWSLFAMIDEAEIEREVRRVKVLVFASIGSGFVLLLSVLFVLARTLIRRPLSALEAHARQLGEGNYTPAGTRGPGEIVRLGEAFDRMAQSIREREERLSSLAEIVESNPGIVLKVRPDGEVVYANRAAREMARVVDPSNGKPDVLLPPDATAMVGSVLVGGRTATSTAHLGSRTVDYTVFGLAGEGRAVFHGTDMTQQNRLEEQLSQARKMEAVGRLAGGIAHDFNNILCVILGYTELILSDPSETIPYRNDLMMIADSARRAADLTGQLLAFSRKQVLQPKVVRMGEVVDGIRNMIGRLVGEQIELDVRIEPGTGCVKVDLGQMNQVIFNLAINARDAMPGGGKLTIETQNVERDESHRANHPELSPGRYVMLAVTDNGVGMDSDTRGKIFEPFFTTKGVGKGTGLGLATVHGIVNQSGGHIWVYSEKGRGTTFKVYFPRVDEADRLVDAPVVVVARPSGSETVLVVEDSDDVRALACRVLSDHGWKVLSASNGEEGVEVFHRERGKIDLLLTDVVMPGMSGRELADQLMAKAPSLPVLFMSGYTENAIVHHGVLEEGIHFIPKPFSPDELARKVMDILGKVPPRA